VAPAPGTRYRKGEITREEYWDSELTDHFRNAVRRRLEAELTGDETPKEVLRFARKVVSDDLE